MKDYVPPDYEEEEDEDTDDEESTGTEESAPPSEEAEPPSSAGAAAVKASKASSKGSKAGKEGQGGLTPYQPAPPDDPIPKGVEDCFGRLYLATDVHCKQCDEHTDRGGHCEEATLQGTKSKKKSKQKEATKEAEEQTMAKAKSKSKRARKPKDGEGTTAQPSAPEEAPKPPEKLKGKRAKKAKDAEAPEPSVKPKEEKPKGVICQTLQEILDSSGYESKGLQLQYRFDAYSKNKFALTNGKRAAVLLLRCNDEAKFRVLARLPEGPEAAGLSPEVWVSSVGMHEFKGKQKKLVSDLKKVFRAQG